MARVDRLSEPDPLIDIATVKTQVRITHDYEDTYFRRLVDVATEAGESFMQRALLPRDLALVLDAFPCGVIELPYPPLLAVNSVVYIDTNGMSQTLSPSSYVLSIPSGPKAQRGRIAPAVDTSWPATQRTLDAVAITYRAGYAELVPESIVQAALLVVTQLYENRSDDPAVARNLWQQFKVYG